MKSFRPTVEQDDEDDGGRGGNGLDKVAPDDTRFEPTARRTGSYGAVTVTSNGASRRFAKSQT